VVVWKILHFLSFFALFLAVYKFKFISFEIVLDSQLSYLALTKSLQYYCGGGNKGSTAVINTLSISSGISLPKMMPDVYRQGLELA